jgi:RNA polymerase sigma-70 factor (ECF subfamily)
VRSKAERGVFVTTKWTVVLAAGFDDASGSEAALSELCAQYWFPLYAYLRRGGNTPHDAEDLVQSFFSHLIERRAALAELERDRARFRSFLLRCLDNFQHGEWRRGQRQKRGGGWEAVPFDEATAEERMAAEFIEQSTPEHVYDRLWAVTLLDRALDRLRVECERAGKADRFLALKDFLAGGTDTETISAAAEKLGLGLAATKSLIHRLRARFRELVRDEISQTVASEAEVEAELRHLLATLAR